MFASPGLRDEISCSLRAESAGFLTDVLGRGVYKRNGPSGAAVMRRVDEPLPRILPRRLANAAGYEMARVSRGGSNRREPVVA